MIFRTEFGLMLYLERNDSVLKSFNKTLLSYKDIHWFGFGQVWYLIVSIPDLCLLTFFVVCTIN